MAMADAYSLIPDILPDGRKLTAEQRTRLSQDGFLLVHQDDDSIVIIWQEEAGRFTARIYYLPPEKALASWRDEFTGMDSEKAGKD